MKNIVKDIQIVLRTATRTPGFMMVVLITLALGIGINTSIFSIFNAILLSPLPYRDPDQLVRIESVRGEEGGEISLREMFDLKELENVFVDVAAHSKGAAYNISGDGAPEEAPATLCTNNLFSLLGVNLLHGQTWPDEYNWKRNYSVVLNNGLWKRRYGGTKNILDKKITLDAAPFYNVYGVLPPGFDYPVNSDLFRSTAFYDLNTWDQMNATT